MKIIIRHGECTPWTHLINENVSHLILPKVFKDLAQKGEEIRAKFSTLPHIYSSHADRAIETALLISPNGEELIQTARKEMEEKILSRNLSKSGGNLYGLLSITLPPHIIVDKLLYHEVSSNIMAEDNFVAVIHSDAMERLGLKLWPGNYAEIP